MHRVKAALRAAFPHTVPVLTGYLFMGAAFGILLQSKGYPFWWATLMGLVIYAGSGQFLAINLMSAGFNLLYAAFMTFMVNARHIFYGLSMLDRFKDMGRRKGYMIFSLTDETYSLLCAAQPPAGVDKRWFWFSIALLDQLYWIAGCTLGGLAGSLLTFNTKGIDFVMTALFVVIFVEQWQSGRGHIAACIGVLATIACLLLFGPVHFLPPAMAVIAILLGVFKAPIVRRDAQ